MENKTLRYFKLACTVLMGTAVCHVQNVQAGANGVINGLGKGWVSVDVRSSTLKTNVVLSPSTNLPTASISPTVGYTYTTNSPAGASTNTYARIKALSLGGWQARVFAAVGDGTTGAEIANRLNIVPATCAELTIDSVINQESVSESGISGNLQVTTKGTAGTALWLRGFEYTGDQSLLPPDDLSTVVNETIEYLKIHGTWKFETLILGPFDFGGGGGGGCPLLVPFTLGSTNIENLVYALDTAAESIPFAIACPSDVTFKCGEAVKFPAAEVTGGCGQIAGSWVPEENYAFPVGTTPVTVTVTDGNGDSTSCTFNVTIADNTKPVAPVLANVTGECSVTPPTPVTTDDCRGSITGTTTTTFPITTQGTTVVTWSFDDGNGNVTTANQNVIVDDVTPPVKPTLANLTFGTCSGVGATPPTPTTTDNCKGTVTGMTTTVFPITRLGTNVVTWTFDDGNGNVTTANQNVILSGLTFSGFYSPISGTGGLCDRPLRNVKQGSNVPIKFDMLCGTSYVTTGTAPTVKIQAWSNCSEVSEPISVAAVYQNDWHYNWDTSVWPRGTYKIIVVLPDGNSQFAFIALK